MSSTRKTIIFKEAARLFREKGYNGATLRELADRAGVQGGSIYHHFASKQDILYAIMEYTMTSLTYKVTKVIEGETAPLARLRKAIKAHIDYHTVDRDETYVADAELRSLEAPNYQKIVQMRRNYEQLFKDIMAAGVADSSMQVGDVGLAAKALLQMCTGISYWYTPGGRKPIGEIADHYVTLFLQGISKTKNTKE